MHVVSDEKQPEMSEREKVRASLAAEFMSDFENLIGSRLQVLMQQAHAHSELPCSPLDTRLDPRVSKFVQFVCREVAVMQVLQAKTFARLLDMLELEYERRGKPHGKRKKAADEAAPEGEPAGAGAEASGRPEEPAASDADAAADDSGRAPD